MCPLIDLCSTKKFAKNSDLWLAEAYLRAVLRNTRTSPFYYLKCSRNIIAAIENPLNPPSKDAMSLFLNRLRIIHELDIIEFQAEKIGVVSNNTGGFYVDAIRIRKIKPVELSHIVNQEMQLTSSDEDDSEEVHTISHRTWLALPDVLRNNWSSFNPELIEHILHCMNDHLASQPNIIPEQQELGPESYSNASNQNRIFKPNNQPFPSILVRIMSTDEHKKEQALNLVTELEKNSIAPQQLNLIIPASYAGASHCISLEDDKENILDSTSSNSVSAA